MRFFAIVAVLAALGTLLVVTARGDEARTLGFREALDEIVKRSTAIGTQQASLEAAQARAIPARLKFAPDLSIVGQAQRQQFDGPALTGKKVEGTSTLNLFRFGGDLAGLHAADRDIETEEARLTSQNLSVEERGIAALAAKIERELEVEVTSRVVAMQVESLRVARERYDRGLLPLQEVEKVSVDLENARARQTDAVIAGLSAQSELESLLGTGERVKIEWPWKEVLSDSAQVTRLSSKELKVDSLPGWRAAKRKLEAEEERVSQARAGILPRLDASFIYGYYEGILGGGVSGPVNSSTTGWTGALTATFPIFDRLSALASARVQAATRMSSELALVQVERDARAEWNLAREVFRTSVTAALARERTLATSRKLYQDGLKRFRAGREAANELNVDQSRLLDSELFAVQGWSAAHLAYARLCHALGLSVWNCGS